MKSRAFVWLVFFAYAVLIAIAVQTIILPRVLPSLHAGSGLMIGGDWLDYHTEASELARRVAAEGWSSWTLRPSKHAISGILGALYVIAVPEPWVFIPVAAALHATAGLALALVLLRFVRRFRLAVIGALPFVLFPTSLLWVTQPLKDGLSVCGFALFLLAWFVALDLARTKRRYWTRAVLCISLLVSGLFLVWLARPYAMVLLWVLGAIAAAGISLVLAFRVWRRKTGGAAASRIVVVLLIAMIASGFLPKDSSRDGVWEITADVQLEQSTGINEGVVWNRSRYVPRAIDDVFQLLAQQRRGSSHYYNAGSNLDDETQFVRASDVIKYLPRATQIALFSPFPRMWFASGSGAESGLMRMASAVEMAFTYLMVLPCVVCLWMRKRLPESWLLLLFCSVPLVMQALFVVNVGTIVRLRFPYLLPFVCLGWACLLAYAPQAARRMRTLVIR